LLASLLYSLLPYQIFKSVFFRGGMTFLTAYLIITWLMPMTIQLFRRHGITSDFTAASRQTGPYTGATPIMGGGVLIVGILISSLLWTTLNQYIIALLLIMFSFGLIGALDDLAKVFHKRRIERGEEVRKSYSDKADGISGKGRLAAEFAVALLVVLGLYLYVDIDGHLVVPFVPIDEWYPYLPKYLFIPFMLLVIVGGANAVNLTDGMDTLATVPLMTCTLFVGAVAYIGGDLDFATKLKIPHLSHDIKELAVLAAAIISAGFAFLKYNAPPAQIYMGDLGALALGSVVSAMFIFVKAELFLPIVGGLFVFSALSTIIQRGFFRAMLRLRGRDFAETYRFFLKSPYHHHLQQLWTYHPEAPKVKSVWLMMLEKLGVRSVPEDNKLLTPQEVNSRVVWHFHLRSIWLFVITLILYFKVR
jgi:phospho-N-acetylmuramoyl-pentapeptide-transferase